jgi:hypothetical protein
MVMLAPKASATAPTITAYGISPANAPAGTWIVCWLTYTDADNDAPTYVRITRIAPITEQTGTQNMIANDTGDTTYSDGKQYYYNWYYFPFIGTGFIKFKVKSGADAEVTKTVVEFQQPLPTLTFSGVTPVDSIGRDYNFFTNYTNIWNQGPTAMDLLLWPNGYGPDVYPMGKNTTGDVLWLYGVEYNVTIFLSPGYYLYSFQCDPFQTFLPNITSGTYWLYIPLIPDTVTITNTTIFPVFDEPGNYTFNMTYTSNGNHAPTLIKVIVNNSAYNMAKVNSSDSDYTDGVNYTKTVYIPSGNYTYHFYAYDGGWSPSITSENNSLYIRVNSTATNWTVTIPVILALALGFGIAILGWRDPKYLMLSGLVWIFGALAVFYAYGSGWAILTLGLGLILLAEGAMSIFKGEAKA